MRYDILISSYNSKTEKSNVLRYTIRKPLLKYIRIHVGVLRNNVNCKLKCNLIADEVMATGGLDTINNIVTFRESRLHLITNPSDNIEITITDTDGNDIEITNPIGIVFEINEYNLR